MKCQECGIELARDAKFCSSCGVSATPDCTTQSGSSDEGKKSGLIGGLVMLGVAGWLGVSGFSNLSSAFGSSEFASAEQIVKKSLKSPSSYTFQDGTVLWSGADQHGNDASIVRLEYDAQNGFGATLRNCQIISYIEKSGNLEWSPTFGIQSCDIGFLSESELVDLFKETNFGV
ncbi:MAG: zinc ribbon domain-containing protein [Woeseia sp.]